MRISDWSSDVCSSDLTLLAKFPNIYKHLYTVSLQVRDREALATILLEFLNQGDDFIEHQLFWLAAIAEEALSGTTKLGAILMRIFELTGEAPIARARVLEIPDRKSTRLNSSH